ncbi:MAG: hypothetical protein Roseis2KO_30040 [Roseivirga sp.]
MRLRQLARKLGVHPEKILTLLADSGHELQNEANSKLTEEQEEIAETHFPPPVVEKEEVETEEVPVAETAAPVAVEEAKPAVVEALEDDTATEEVAEEVVAEKEPDLEHLEVPFGPPSHATSQVSAVGEAETVTEVAPEEPKKEVIQLEKPKPEVKVYNAIEEDEEFINAELIKTEKPVLEGLKVVGKIELPEPKKPEPKTEEEADTEEFTDKPDKKNQQRRNGKNDPGRGRNRKNQRQRLSPLEYERQKAERLAKKKKQEAERKLKQKKEEHYRAKLEAKAKAKKKAAVVKPKKTAPQEEEAMAPLPINGMSRPKPVAPKAKKEKGPLKRFWGWLNGESDKFG